MGKNPLLFVITGDNKQECFMPCGGVESVADATRRRRGNPASRILFRQLNKEGEGMSKRETYEAKTEELLLPIAEENGVEIYDVEYVKEGSDWYLRAYIDKPDGVNIGDCEAVSRALSDKLDEADFIEDAYILEVSSPGLGRTLKKDKHLEKSLGEEVEIRLYKPVDKCREFTGVLKSYDADSITIDTAEKEMTFARKEIALIRLALDF